MITIDITDTTFYSADLDDEVPISELHPNTVAEFVGGEGKIWCYRDGAGLYVRELRWWPTLPPYDLVGIEIRYPEDRR